MSQSPTTSNENDGLREKDAIELQADFNRLLARLREARPLDRSDIARSYAVVITQTELAHAYLTTNIVSPLVFASMVQQGQEKAAE